MEYDPYNDRQGRDGMHSVNASRAIFGLPPLHDKDGGMHVNGALSFPIEREEDDKPIATPESAAEPVPRIAQAIVGFIVLVLLAISAFALPAMLSH